MTGVPVPAIVFAMREESVAEVITTPATWYCNICGRTASTSAPAGTLNSSTCRPWVCSRWVKACSTAG